jgi:hypothetical protein
VSSVLGKKRVTGRIMMGQMTWSVTEVVTIGLGEVESLLLLVEVEVLSGAYIVVVSVTLTSGCRPSQGKQNHESIMFTV